MGVRLFTIPRTSGCKFFEAQHKIAAIGTKIFTALMGQPPQNDTDHQRWWEVNGASHFSLDEIQNYVDPFIKRDAAFRGANDQALNHLLQISSWSLCEIAKERGILALN